MSKIGLKYPVYKTSTSAGVIGKAIKADIKITLNNGKNHADDSLDDSDTSFKEGKITLGVNDISDVVQSVLLGHAIVGGEMTAMETDKAPFTGVGIYGPKLINHETKWRAIWFPKVKFTEPDDSNETKAESIKFGTPIIIGDIFPDPILGWKKEQTFDTEALAIAYINAKAGITPQVATPTASIAAGTYAGTQSVALTCETADATIYYTTNGLTPTDEDTEYTTALSIAASTMLKAMAVKAAMADSAVMQAEYIISA